MNPLCFAIGNSSVDLSLLSIRKIGATNAYKKRNECIANRKEKTGPSQQYYKDEITKLDTNITAK